MNFEIYLYMKLKKKLYELLKFCPYNSPNIFIYKTKIKEIIYIDNYTKQHIIAVKTATNILKYNYDIKLFKDIDNFILYILNFTSNFNTK
jgi:hypothetical protein